MQNKMPQIQPESRPLVYECQICRYQAGDSVPEEMGKARGNTRRFCQTIFQLWQCPRCQTIHTVGPVDFADLYKNYPLNKRRLDSFARQTLGNLLRRLVKAGLKKSHAILDYGCGNGILLQYLQGKGYANLTGYDPFVEEYSRLPQRRFDCVIANDVIEHCPSPRAMIADCLNKLGSEGLLYIGTADAKGVEMRNLDPHIMRLHLPFHRVIVTEKALHHLVAEVGLRIVSSYTRSYMDTVLPFANYRFLDEFNRALGHEMDRAFEPSSSRLVLKKPRLLFYGLFGYFFPSAHEPAVVLRKSLPYRIGGA